MRASHKYIRKDGFTIVELLAVIIVLALIAAITIPVITHIIGDVEDNTTTRSMENLEKAVKNYYYNNKLKNGNKTIIFTCGNGSCTNGADKLNIEGDSPESGTVTVDGEGRVTFESIVINGYHCAKNAGEFNCSK